MDSTALSSFFRLLVSNYKWTGRELCEEHPVWAALQPFCHILFTTILTTGTAGLLRPLGLP